MVEFSVIAAKDAPPKPRPGPLTKRMKEYEGFVAGVRKGQVGRLDPGTGDTSRGIALRVAHAGKRSGKAVETWVADGAVYFRLADA